MLLKFKYYLLLAIISIALFSCGKESSCFKSTGKIITEQRAISNDIVSIKTESNIDIVITQSAEASLIIEGGENLLPYVNTDISGTELIISSDNKCGLFRDYNIPITVYLSIPNLINIDYTGQGNITTTNTLTLNDFSFTSSAGTGSINMNINAINLSVFQHSGPADFTFAGTVNTSYVYTLGNGWFYLNNLIAKDTHVSHNGSGDIMVNSTNSLRIELRDVGNIHYWGNPNLNVTVHTGSGKIIKE